MSKTPAKSQYVKKHVLHFAVRGLEPCKIDFCHKGIQTMHKAHYD